MSNSAVSVGDLRLDAATVRALPGVWVRAAAYILVIALPIVVTPWGRDAYSAPKVLVLYGLTAVMLMGWLVAFAVSRQRTWILTRPELWVWAFLFAALLSSITSSNPRLTFFGAPERYEGLFAFGCYVALFFIGARFFGSQEGFRRLAATAAGAGLAVVSYALLQLVLPAPFAGEAFIRDWYGALGVLRVSSTLGSPIVLGGYLCLMVPMWLVLGSTAHRRTRILWLAGGALGYAAIAATFTRAAWLGIAAGTVTLGLIAGRDLARRARGALAAAVIGVVLGGAILLGTATPRQISERVTSSANVQVGSAAQRVFIWTKTIELIAARPFFGWGIETLREVFPYERAELVRYFGLRPVIIDKAHNDLLQVAVSIGVPGAMAHVAMWAAVLLAAVHSWRRGYGDDRLLAAGWLAAVMAYLIQVQFSFSAVALAPVVWLLAGSASGWEAREASADGTRASDSWTSEP